MPVVVLVVVLLDTTRRTTVAKWTSLAHPHPPTPESCQNPMFVMVHVTVALLCTSLRA